MSNAVHLALSALTVVCSLAVASCDSEAPRASDDTQSSADTAAARSSTPTGTTDTLPLGVHRPEELVEAATAIVAFLRGEADFDRIRLADSVTFYLAPEGGGTRRSVSRERLRDRSNWMVRGRDPQGKPGITYSLVPPRDGTELTTRAGRHLKCLEYPLASIYQDLARLPHVGVMLAYGTGCLQKHNFTLVFDPDQKPPTLIAAVYDQWEW
jgi:hypothetical protein